MPEAVGRRMCKEGQREEDLEKLNEDGALRSVSAGLVSVLVGVKELKECRIKD